MRVPPRLLATVLFVAVGLISLMVAGLLDWIVGVLFLTLEFLSEILRNVYRRQKKSRENLTKRTRPASPSHATSRFRGIGRRKSRPGRRPIRRHDATPAEPVEGPPAPPRFRVLVPLSVDDPDLIDFALEECRIRQAELIVLWLRPMGVIPMGPNPLPGFSEDPEAHEFFDRVTLLAGEAGVPSRTLYEITADRPSTISEVARTVEADVVVVGATRRSRFFLPIKRDMNPTILKLLPDHASLMIHAS